MSKYTKDDLQDLRKKIDVVDNKIMLNLKERFNLTHKVGLYKAKNNLSAFSKEREQEIYKAKRELSKKFNLDDVLVEKIFKSIIVVVRKEHAVIALRYKGINNEKHK